MRCYRIHNDRVTVHAEAPEISGNAVLLHSTKDLDARRFPVTRLVDIWNTLPGATAVKRFASRDAAVRRLWEALEALPLSSSRSDSKQARMIALLQRPEGASIDDLMAATGWQAHSVRGVLSGVLRKKLGLNVASARDGNVRIYRIAA